MGVGDGRRETGAAKWRREEVGGGQEASVRDCTGMKTGFGDGWREKEETKKEGRKEKSSLEEES